MTPPMETGEEILLQNILTTVKEISDKVDKIVIKVERHDIYIKWLWIVVGVIVSVMGISLGGTHIAFK